MGGTLRSKRFPVLVKLCAFLALAAVVATIVLTNQQDAEATFPGTNGKIAFASARGDTLEVYIMNPDGSDQTQITEGLGVLPFNGGPNWSPDGQTIVFMHVDFADGANDLYLIKPDGSGLQNLTAGLGLRPSAPAFSPDGSKIAFGNLAGSQFQIYVMNIDGTGITNLSNSSTSDNEPDWSPDGSKIAFVRSAGFGLFEIFVMNADGSDQTNLTNNPSGKDLDPSWSPDGSRLAFARDTDPSEATEYDLFVMNADGTGATNLTNSSGPWELQPDWSPDGTKITFYISGTSIEDHADVYVMNEDGSGITKLTNAPLGDADPAWQPLPLPPTITPTPTLTPTLTPTPTPTPKDPDGDTDDDGIPNSSDPNDDNDACTDDQENGPDETLGGRRNPHNPWDFYDVLGPGGALPVDGIIDLPNDILGVIQHYAPTGTELGYSLAFDRGPSTGPNPWNMTAPDGVIDLANDILGVVFQFGHSCQ